MRYPRTVLLLWLIILGGCKARQLVKTTPQMDIESQFWVRVLLLDDTKTCTLKVPCSFAVLNPQTQAVETRSEPLNIPASISISAGRIVVAGQSFISRRIIIAPDEPHIFSLNGDDYRGKLELRISPEGNSFDVINLVPLEPYLAGVVGAEMPDYWEPEALKAQVIAARTYCLYIKKHFDPKRNWDLTKTAANQVYLGIAAESKQVWDAVEQTEGNVLVCKQPDGPEEIFPAYYSSTCGGHTENSRSVFGDSFETLVGVPCPYCERVAKPAFFFWPMVQFHKDSITNKLLQKYPNMKKLGEIKDIIAAKQSNYGKFSRLTSVKLIGPTGEKAFLRAEDLRLTIDPTGNKLKSTICKIVDMGKNWAFVSGRGYGHGVGMCQCGAEGMAREGKTAEQILSYYYPGSKIVRVY